jgi:hypothetical protein
MLKYCSIGACGIREASVAFQRVIWVPPTTRKYVRWSAVHVHPGPRIENAALVLQVLVVGVLDPDRQVDEPRLAAEGAKRRANGIAED